MSALYHYATAESLLEGWRAYKKEHGDISLGDFRKMAGWGRSQPAAKKKDINVILNEVLSVGDDSAEDEPSLEELLAIEVEEHGKILSKEALIKVAVKDVKKTAATPKATPTPPVEKVVNKRVQFEQIYTECSGVRSKVIQVAVERLGVSVNTANNYYHNIHKKK